MSHWTSGTARCRKRFSTDGTGTTASLSYNKINSLAGATTGLSCCQALRLMSTWPSVTDNSRQTPTASYDTPAPARRQIKRFISGSVSHPITCFDTNSRAAPQCNDPDCVLTNTLLTCPVRSFTNAKRRSARTLVYATLLPHHQSHLP
jgi:hypothetical protein